MKIKNNNYTRISNKVLETELKSSQKNCPVFSFEYLCNKNCVLYEWNFEELKTLTGALKNISQIRWDNLSNSKYEYKKIANYKKPLPENVSKEKKIRQLKIRKRSKLRVYGFRVSDVFNIIWFDRDHCVCPYNKNRN